MTAVATPPRRRWLRSPTLRVLLSDRACATGLFLLAVICFAAIFAPWLAPFGPDEATPMFRLMPPGTEGHLLGLDHQGRDILSRLIWGARLTLAAGIIPVAVGAAISIPIGMIAAWYDSLGAAILRVMDVLFAFPMALLAIMVAAFLGPGVENMMISLVIVLLPYNVRVVYQATVEQKSMPYVEALRAAGTSTPAILFAELLPNVASAAIVYSTTIVGSIVITAAGLSFLGLGVQPPGAEWGIMVAEGRTVVFVAPHVSAIPGLFLTLLVVACSLVGDGIRDALDPRVRASMGS
ncbi:ABC transporter permease [Chthonobacter albigriseus]|uniref:ABC transporter permease n=1 Tax=Chthonobacter albigriseus TaxID=1683161 RepID=UPI0015EE7A7A|nr:ABC transporter permease [Chthonobacter albigriseus]